MPSHQLELSTKNGFVWSLLAKNCWHPDWLTAMERDSDSKVLELTKASRGGLDDSDATVEAFADGVCHKVLELI